MGKYFRKFRGSWHKNVYLINTSYDIFSWWGQIDWKLLCLLFKCKSLGNKPVQLRFSCYHGLGDVKVLNAVGIVPPCLASAKITTVNRQPELFNQRQSPGAVLGKMCSQKFRKSNLFFFLSFIFKTVVKYNITILKIKDSFSPWRYQ